MWIHTHTSKKKLESGVVAQLLLHLPSLCFLPLPPTGAIVVSIKSALISPPIVAEFSFSVVGKMQPYHGVGSF